MEERLLGAAALTCGRRCAIIVAVLEEELSQLRQAIQDLGYAWQAGVTALSNLSAEQRQRRLGLRPEFAAMQQFAATLAERPAPRAKYPAAWDWRRVDGADWTTPVYDQGECAACIAFSIVAVMETMLKRARRDARLQPNLSEAHLFFTGCEGGCAKGWSPSEGLEHARAHGVADEACFPYQDRDLPGSAVCADWHSRAVKVARWQEVADVSARKAWLAGKGPMLACLGVYDDLFHYTGGVYRHTQGKLLGYHAVCVTGYSEAEKAWTGKNSWGPEWGEAGWFRIGYGEAGIDTDFAMYGIEGVVAPAKVVVQPAPAVEPGPVLPVPEAGAGCNALARAMGRLRGG
jgi:C1A family cysteine protease